MQMNTLDPYTCEKKQQRYFFCGFSPNRQPFRAFILTQTRLFTRSVTKFAMKSLKSAIYLFDLPSLLMFFICTAMGQSISFFNSIETLLKQGFRGYCVHLSTKKAAALSCKWLKCDEILTFLPMARPGKSLLSGNYQAKHTIFRGKHLNMSFCQLALERQNAFRALIGGEPDYGRIR